MVDNTTVCCMCGDVGFPDKLFRCLRCASRYQHTYCGSYYDEMPTSSKPSGICDWCRSDGGGCGFLTGKPTLQYSKKSTVSLLKEPVSGGVRSTYASGERIKQRIEHEAEVIDKRKTTRSSVMSAGNGVAPSSSPSSKSGTVRRYKLLKDVLC